MHDIKLFFVCVDIYMGVYVRLHPHAYDFIWVTFNFFSLIGLLILKFKDLIVFLSSLTLGTWTCRHQGRGTRRCVYGTLELPPCWRCCLTTPAGWGRCLSLWMAPCWPALVMTKRWERHIKATCPLWLYNECTFTHYDIDYWICV